MASKAELLDPKSTYYNDNNSSTMEDAYRLRPGESNDSYYSRLKPTAPTTPSTPTTDDSSSESLYPRIGAAAGDSISEPNAGRAIAARNASESAALAPVSYDDIYAGELSKKRGTIDSIKALHDQAITDYNTREEAAGANRSAGLRAMAASFGLGGSPTSFSESNRSGNATRENIKSNTSAEKGRASLEISNVYDKVDANAKALYDTKTSANRDAIEKVTARVKKDSEGQVQSIGASLGGQYTYAEARDADPDLFKKLKEQSGLSEYELRTLYEGAIPEGQKPKKINYQTPTADGKTAYTEITYNPATGKQETNTYTIDAPYSLIAGFKDLPKLSNGVPLIPKVGEDGKITYERAIPLTEEEKLKNDLTRSQINENNAQTDKARRTPTTGGGGTKGTPPEDFDSARTFIDDNPDASPAELTSYIQQNTKLTDGEIKNLLNAKGKKPSTDSDSGEKFLNADYFKGLYNDSDLQTSAADAGYKTGGVLGFGKKGDSGAYLNHLMSIVEQYRAAGYSDKDILKMMQ